MKSSAANRVLDWPPDISPSQWAQQYRVLTPAMTAEPGRWRKTLWQSIISGARNHAWDLEVYQCAAADWANVGIVLQQPPTSVTPPAPLTPRKPLDRLTREFDEARRGRERPYFNPADW